MQPWFTVYFLDIGHPCYDCDNRFLGRLSCYPCYNNPEGNTLAATEFVRLLEDSGSVTAKQSNGK